MLQNNIQIFQECWIQKVIDICPLFNRTYYTLHYFLLSKCHETIWMFYRKFADERDNQVNNPGIYNVKRDNLQPLTTGSVLKIYLFIFSVQFRNCIFYTGNSSAKQNIQVISFGIIKQLLSSYTCVNQLQLGISIMQFFSLLLLVFNIACP